MQGDDLSIFLFWITLAVTFGYETVKAETTLRRIILGALAVVFLLCGLLWFQIKLIWPPLTEATAAIATSPQSWFVLFIFISAILIFGRSKRHKAKSRPDSAESGAAEENAELAEKLARQISELRGQIDSITDVHNATTVAAAKLAHEVRDRLENLAKGAGIAQAATNPQTDRDLLLLMHFVVYQSTTLMLDDLLADAPDVHDGPLELGGDFVVKNAASQEFIQLVRRKLDPGSWRRSDFENVISMATADAERQVEQTPMDQRPAGIDPLDIRKWTITHLQCARAVRFLKAQRREAGENLLNQRSNLLQQYRLRNPS